MRRAFGAVLALGVAAACTPIEPVPLSNAPLNRCPCANGSTCDSATNRCRVQTPGNFPGVPFFLVVQVPNTSVYGAGDTFVLYGDRSGTPAFTRKAQITDPVSNLTFTTQCRGPRCVALGGMSVVTNLYRVAASQSLRVRYPLADQQLIPARVEYELVANTTDATAVRVLPGLPVESRFVAPRLGPAGAQASAALPSGSYRRVMYPQPPFDALFPPISQVISLNPAPPRQANFSTTVDPFVLDDATLDPVDTRTVTVTRADGLEGWQVWVADRVTKRRISTLRTLSGASQTLTLDTAGERRTPNGGLGDDVEVVVAPPAGYIGVPRFINPVNGGDLGTIRYPFVYPPASVSGVVAETDNGEGGRPLGYPAVITFESVTISTPREASEFSPLLRYSTTVSTDDSGRFATVLPPGTYNATVEPLLGTGFATSREVVIVVNGVKNAFTLRPSKRTVARGRVVLGDGRPLVEGTILATPQTPSSGGPKPRPNQTRTDLEGRYSLELDQGPYVITAIPKAGTGFPRVAVRAPQIPPEELDLADITVPAPVVMSFQLRDGGQNENTVANALVRIFTVPGVTDTPDLATTTAEPVEIGNGRTDANGQVEILLAPSPP